MIEGPFEARILAVDPDEGHRYAVSRPLRRARFQVVEATSGREALRLTREQRPDLLVVDVNLPDVPGYEVCRTIRADGELAGTAILHVSATSLAPGDRAHGLEQGADGLVIHPLDPDELVATVRAVLRARRGERVTPRSSEPAGAHLELMRVLGAVPFALGLVDRELRCTWCNPRFLALGGRTSRDQHVMTIDELLPGPMGAALATAALGVMETGREAVVGLPVIGSGHVHRAHLVPVGARGHDGVVCSVLEPVDARTWALDEQVRARDALIATASHALRDPLSAVLLRLSSLPRLLEAGRHEDARERLISARQQVDHMSRLLDRYLDASLVGSICPIEVDLVGVVDKVVGELREAATRAGCELRVTSSGPTRGCWDPMRVEVVVSHLLDNAVKYAPGQPIDVHLEGAQEAVRLLVRDRGPGIPEVLRDEVFRAAMRGAPSGVAGRGLGLWISREGVLAHGGTIHIETPPGGGAAFVVDLPRA